MGNTDPDDRPRSIEQRLADIEHVLEALNREVRTGRVVLIDEHGAHRVVAETRGTVTELRLVLADTLPGRSSGVVLFASAGESDLEPSIGVQLWADGNDLAGCDVTRHPDGTWTTAWHHEQPAAPPGGGAATDS